MNDKEFEVLRDYINIINNLKFGFRSREQLNNNLLELIDCYNKNKDILTSDNLKELVIGCNVEAILHYKKQFFRKRRYNEFLEDVITSCENINWEFDFENCNSPLSMLSDSIHLIYFKDYVQSYKETLDIQKNLTIHNCKDCQDTQCMYKHPVENDERWKLEYTNPCDNCSIKETYPNHHYFICGVCERGIEHENSFCQQQKKDLK